MSVETRAILLVGFEGVQTLDLVGPLDVFAKANGRAAGREDLAPSYELIVASPDGGVISSEAGLRLADTVRLTRWTDNSTRFWWPAVPKRR